MVAINFPSANDTIKTTEDFTFTWEGDSIRNNESVAFNINDFFSGNVTLFVNDQVGDTTIVVAQKDVADLVAATSTCILERTYAPTLTETPNAGGEIKARYRAKNKDYMIE